MEILITSIKLIFYIGVLVFNIILIVKTFRSFERIKYIDKMTEQNYRLIKEIYRRQENIQKEIQEYIRKEEKAASENQ